MLTCALILSFFAMHPDAPEKYEKFTPGVSVRCSAIELGVYRNSLGEESAYAGVSIPTPVEKLRVLTGAATGYPAADVIPAVAFVVDMSERVEIVLLPGIETRSFKSDAAMSLRLKF